MSPGDPLFPSGQSSFEYLLTMQGFQKLTMSVEWVMPRNQMAKRGRIESAMT
jgi:hypothetical protein